MNRRVYETVARKRKWEGPREPAELAHEAALGSKGARTFLSALAIDVTCSSGQECPRSMNRRVYETVARKRKWEGPREPAELAHEAALGSKGWHTRGYLPHFDRPGTIQMLTFRLADALPAARRHEWASLLAIADEREQHTKLEAYLDLGHGECVLRDARVATAVEEVFLRFDGQRYRVAAWVVMPNHVHLLFELWNLPLGQLLKAWKGTSANAANRVLNRRGQVWQEDYWDRYMRDEEHFRKARHYIEWNPVKAFMAKQPEDWPWSSANPKWQWSSAERYTGGHLLRAAAPGAEERGHSCPPARLQPTTADRNVRAPSTTPKSGQECPRSCPANSQP